MNKNKFEAILLIYLILSFQIFSPKALGASSEVVGKNKDAVVTIQKIKCVEDIKNSEIKSVTINLINQISSGTAYPAEVQDSYQKALDIYGKNLMNKKIQQDRVCLLGLLVAAAKGDPELSLQELMADWFNGDLKVREVTVFTRDLKAISTPPGAKEFSKSWIAELRKYTQAEE